MTAFLVFLCLSCRDDVLRHEFYINSDHLLPGKNPVAYLMSPNEFLQSGVYVYANEKTKLVEERYVEEDVFMFTRFKPDNLMHAIHDDVLPTYTTLARIYSTLVYPYDVRIVFADDYAVSPYDELIQKLTEFPLTSVATLSNSCFRKVIVGFDRSSLWYQYGFSQPQGPLPRSNNHILERINALFLPYSSQNSHIVVFSRRDNRLILNEAELSSVLAKRFSSRVIFLDLSTHSLTEIKEAISTAKLVVGMHGALFASIVWLPSDSTVLELFPYGVPPDNYSPYRTLAETKRLNYIAWRNTDVSNTVGHPEYPKELGGLSHLSADERRKILGEEEVPLHLCCEDPSWLYHIYQDTIVDVHQVLSLLSDVE